MSCDFFFVALAFSLATRINLSAGSVLQPWWNGDATLPINPNTHLLLGFALLYGALVTLLSYSEGLYQQEILPKPEGAVLFKAVFWGTLLIAVALWLSAPGTRVLPALPLSAALNLTFLFSWRAWKERASTKKLADGKGAHNVLIVGSNAYGRKLAQYFQANPQMGRVVKGFLDDHPSSTSKVLGAIDDLPDIAKEHFIDEIVLLPGAEKEAQRVIRLARQHRLSLRLVPDLFGFESRQPHMDWVGEWPVITLHEERLPQFALFTKRILDVMLSGGA